MHLKEMTNQNLIEKTKTMIAAERKIKSETLVLLSEIWARKLFFPRYRDFAEFCMKELQMSKNQAWQRSQIAKCIRFFPKFLEMIKSGEASMTAVRLASTKVTAANFEMIREGIKGKSKRQAEMFLSTVTPKGELLPKEPCVELRIDLPKSLSDKIDRAREVLSSRGKNPKIAEVLDEALEALLDKKDPMRKAERSMQKKDTKSVDEKKSENKAASEKNSPSRYIPSDLKHQVYLRDEGRCTHIDQNGQRCQERSMLEFDHRRMYCRGGEHSLENIRLLCRRHNQNEARRIIGSKYLDKHIINKYSSDPVPEQSETREQVSLPGHRT